MTYAVTGETGTAAMHDAELRALLTSALEEEAVMLDSLRDLFIAQRKALVMGDPEALDDGVFAATRVMRTLEEARQRRQAITTALLGAGVGTDDLDHLLVGSVARPIRRARERLRIAAEGLRREVSLLRAILRSALEDNRSYLETLVGEKQNAFGSVPASYSPTMGGERSDLGVIVDRTA